MLRQERPKGMEKYKYLVRRYVHLTLIFSNNINTSFWCTVCVKHESEPCRYARYTQVTTIYKIFGAVDVL